MNQPYELIWSDEEFRPMTWINAYNLSREREASGWRLPTIFELQSARKTNVAGFKDEIYWSSSENIEDNRIVWYVSFHEAASPPMFFKTDDMVCPCFLG